jgi:hypothetical protein
MNKEQDKPEKLEIWSLLQVEDHMWSGGGDGVIRIWNPEVSKE